MVRRVRRTRRRKGSMKVQGDAEAKRREAESLTVLRRERKSASNEVSVCQPA